MEESSSKQSGEFTRQIITVRQTTYDRLRNMALEKGQPRIKIGDVIEMFMELTDKHVKPEIVQLRLDELRNAGKSPINAKLRDKLKGLTPAQQQALLEKLELMEAEQELKN